MQETARQPRNAQRAYTQVTAARMRPEQADRHSDTVEASRTPPTTRTTCRAAAGPRSLTLPAVRIGLPSDDSDARGMPPDAVHVERLENPQVTNPICARDAAGRIETGEMPTLDTDAAAPVDRGQRDEWRQSERSETNVVWLITQRRLAASRRAITWPRTTAQPPVENWPA